MFHSLGAVLLANSIGLVMNRIESYICARLSIEQSNTGHIDVMTLRIEVNVSNYPSL